jgi:hypothetical protein
MDFNLHRFSTPNLLGLNRTLKSDRLLALVELQNQQDPRLEEEIQKGWERFVQTYPSSSGIGEAYFHLAESSFYRWDFAESILQGLRGSIQAQEQEWKVRNIELSHRALSLLKPAENDRIILSEALNLIYHAPLGETPLESILQELTNLEDPVLLEVLLKEIQSFLFQNPESENLIIWYSAVAEIHERLGDEQEASRIRDLINSVL